MKRLVAVLVLVMAVSAFGGSLQSELGIPVLEHHWAFNHGDMSEDPTATGANKGDATIIENFAGSHYFTANAVGIVNNPVGDTWGDQRRACIGLPSNIIKGSTISAKTIELWVKDINAEGCKNSLFYLGDGVQGEWQGHPMLMATSRENEYGLVSWFQSQQNPGGGYTQRSFTPNVHADRPHQLVVVCAADNTWVEIYYDGVYKNGWAGVPWEGPGLDKSVFNDIANRLGAGASVNGERWLTGEIYDFRIWGCEMSPEQVAASYQLGPEEFGYFSPGDYNYSGTVDLEDFAILANNWLRTDCDELNGWCNGIDINLDHNVDTNELSVLVNNWLY